MRTIAERLEQMVGKTVVVEGTFPIPTPNGQVAYSPAKGKLVEVFTQADGTAGFDLLEEGYPEPVLYLCVSLRSVQVYLERRIATPKIGLIT